MNFGHLFSIMRLSQNDAEVIFDRNEPVGAATDLVMPRRRWFGRKESRASLAPADASSRTTGSANTTNFLS